MPRDEKGCVQVYTGDGKGKTTAALGLCFRAAGHGMRSCVIQFMKGQIGYGELYAVERFEGLITIYQGGRDSFVKRTSPDPEDVRLAQETLAHAIEVVAQKEYDIVVLDEINMALDFGLIGLGPVLELIEEKPEHTELILTGRTARPEVIERAHLVTEMKEIKHYWKEGIPCRKGIEC